MAAKEEEDEEWTSGRTQGLAMMSEQYGSRAARRRWPSSRPVIQVIKTGDWGLGTHLFTGSEAVVSSTCHGLLGGTATEEEEESETVGVM
ncbi:MAG: hypothetical protein Q9172_005376 [Xanthocarpia lactea]